MLNKEVNVQINELLFIPVDKIRDNDYDLSINKYKEIEYEEVEYQSSSEILKEIKNIEDEIQQGLENLGELLNENI